MTADTYSSTLGWLNQGTGNNNNSWGDNCDTAIFPVFERGIAGLSTHAVTGGTLDLSSSPPPAGMTAAIDMIHTFTGTLTSNQVVQVPNLPKLWIVKNGTSGNYTLKFKTPSGSASSEIKQGGWTEVWCDGADGISVGLSSDLLSRQMQAIDGTIGAPGVSFANETTLGIRRVSSGSLAITSGGVDIMTVSAAGVDIASGLALTVGSVKPVPPGTIAPYSGISAPTGWYLATGSAVTRAGDPELLAAITASFTGNLNGTTTISNLSSDLRNLGLEGSKLEGTGIQTGTTIVSIDSATQMTISLAATTTATGVSLRSFPYGNGDGVSTFNIPAANGRTLIGRDNMGGTAANLVTHAKSGIYGTRLGATGGAETHTLDETQIPSHIHSGTSDTESAHTHPYRDRYYSEANLGASYPYKEQQPNSGNYNGKIGSSASDSDNQYFYYYDTNTSAGTAHSHTFDTDTTGGGLEHNNMPPGFVINYIVKR